MTELDINFTSQELWCSSGGQPTSFSAGGLKWTFSAKETNNGYKCELSWKFDWTDQKFKSIEGLSGTINVRCEDSNSSQNFPVELTRELQSITKVIDMYSDYSFNYTISLTPIQKPNYESLFLPSDMNDTVLIVEGMKLYVNRIFLSYHSDYFKTLFSGSFKEGGMDEIPIEDVSFDDFGLLMSTIYPKSTFPNDRNVEKLLEMSDRFMFPGVISRVEYHLIHNSKFVLKRMILMADKYRMETLLEKCIRQLTSTAAMKELKATEEYKELSRDTKAKILDRVEF